MFLNILRISVVTIGTAVVIFHSYKPTGSTNQPEVQTSRKYKPAGSTNQPEVQTSRKYKPFGIKHNTLCRVSRYTGRARSSRIYSNEKRFKTNLYMHNTNGNVALMIMIFRSI